MEMWVRYTISPKHGHETEFEQDVANGSLPLQLEDLIGYGTEHPNQPWYISHISGYGTIRYHPTDTDD